MLQPNPYRICSQEVNEQWNHAHVAWEKIDDEVLKSSPQCVGHCRIDISRPVQNLRKYTIRRSHAPTDRHHTMSASMQFHITLHPPCPGRSQLPTSLVDNLGHDSLCRVRQTSLHVPSRSSKLFRSVFQQLMSPYGSCSPLLSQPHHNNLLVESFTAPRWARR